MANQNLSLDFSSFGTGAQIAIDEKAGVMMIQVPISAAALKAAPVSSTGKSKLVASSGGFQSITPKLKVNLVVTTPLS